MSRSQICAWFALPITALAMSACGTAPEDESRNAGNDIGKAIAQVQTAKTAEAAGEAIDDMRAAVRGMKKETRERVRAQADTQASSLSDAVKALRDAGVGGGNADDALNDVRQAGLELRAQAEAFQSANNSVAVAFWEGVEEGYDDEIG